jgi:hypothetical protein
MGFGKRFVACILNEDEETIVHNMEELIRVAAKYV